MSNFTFEKSKLGFVPEKSSLGYSQSDLKSKSFCSTNGYIVSISKAENSFTHYKLSNEYFVLIKAIKNK